MGQSVDVGGRDKCVKGARPSLRHYEPKRDYKATNDDGSDLRKRGYFGFSHVDGEGSLSWRVELERKSTPIVLLQLQ